MRSFLSAGVLVFSALLVSATGAQERASFELGAMRVAPGQRVSGFLAVPAGVDAATQVPVTVIHGLEDGPVLALIAGTHGYEYPPILALQRLREAVSPTSLSGTLVLVHVANMPSFLGRTIYTSPVDGKNLNRVFPGDPEGTVSERIAHVLTREVLERADVVLDMHAGDGNEDLRPFVYMPVTGEADMDDRVRSVTLAFGIDHVVVDEARDVDPRASQFVDHTALVRGAAALTTETGGLGSIDQRWVDIAEEGAWRVLAHLGMVGGEVALTQGTVWLEAYEVIPSPATGMFRPAVQSGYVVAQGTLIGTVVDFFGDPVAEVRAPFPGVVNYVVGTPPISQGEPVAMVSRIREAG